MPYPSKATHRLSPLAPIVLAPIVLASILGCDPGPQSIGSQETGEDETTDTDTDTDTDTIGVCGEEQVSAQFELTGLDPGFRDLRMVCASTVGATPEGYAIALTGCVDQLDSPVPDLEIQLSGDWLEPQAEADEGLEVRYVELPIMVVIDQVTHDYGTGRWLVLSNPDTQFSLPLIAVDAPSLYPQAFLPTDFDYGTVEINQDSVGCDLVAHPLCESMEPVALLVTPEGSESVSVSEGSESLSVGDGSDVFQVLVERARRSVIDPCTAPNEYQFGLVAAPNP